MKTSTNMPGSAKGSFVPMTEAQMESIRGGTEWPEWFVDLVDEIVESTTEALDYLESVLQPTPIDFDQDYWDEVQTTLQDEGFVIPSWDDIGPTAP